MRVDVLNTMMNSHSIVWVIIAIVLFAGIGAAAEPRAPMMPTSTPIRGPLIVSTQNPRYFAGPDGNAVFLTGSHYWANLVDLGPNDPPVAFDFDGYLDFLEKHHHNFIRLWSWELSKWQYPKGEVQFTSPMAWERTGPGVALDGKPRFDLTRPNPAYFMRLRERIIAAGQRGIYVGIVLFEGNGLYSSLQPQEGHPFATGNNINNLGIEPEASGSFTNLHTLKWPEVTRLQEVYVRWVVEHVNDLDNVLYEIVNESGVYSREWQEHMVRFVKSCEGILPKRHPVGMSFLTAKGGASGPNSLLYKSPADWIAPGREGGRDGGYRRDPPAADGKKVILADTDHLFGIGGDVAWVWKSVCRGLNPIYMDSYRQRDRPNDPPYPNSSFSDHFNARTDLDPRWDGIRRNLGYARAFVQRMDLNKARPDSTLAYSGYCLTTEREYLIYLPDGGSTIVDLEASAGELNVEWLDPESGQVYEATAEKAGAVRSFAAPFKGHAVLFLHPK